jgi:hypothetical protein
MTDDAQSRSQTAAGFEDAAVALVEMVNERLLRGSGGDNDESLQLASVLAQLALGQRVAELSELMRGSER